MMASAVVIAAYAIVLALVLFPPAKLRSEAWQRRPWWRDVRFWASVVIASQIVVYAIWG